MREIEWKQQYNIGVEIVDRAHRRLFSIVRKIMELLDEDDSAKIRRTCVEGIKFFKSYAVQHFAEEEAYMASVSYGGLAHHQRVHTALRERTLPELESELQASDYAPQSVEHFLGVCIGWLTGHIMIEDQAITSAPEEAVSAEGEVAVLTEAVARFAREVFELDVSPDGSGLKISGGICYEFRFKSNAGRDVKTAILIEESLVLATAGRMLGIVFESSDEIVHSAAAELSEMLMYRVLGALDSEHSYERTERCLRPAARFYEMCAEPGERLVQPMDTPLGRLSFMYLP